jgi:hypothetical protein
VALWHFTQGGNHIALDSYPYIYFIVLHFRYYEAGIKGIIDETNEMASCYEEFLYELLCCIAIYCKLGSLTSS